MDQSTIHAVSESYYTLSVVWVLSGLMSAMCFFIAANYHQSVKKAKCQKHKSIIRDIKNIFIFAAICSVLWPTILIFKPAVAACLVSLLILNGFLIRYFIKTRSMDVIYAGQSMGFRNVDPSPSDEALIENAMSNLTSVKSKIRNKKRCEK